MNRTQLETVIARRCGSMLTAAGMLITPQSHSDDLSDPIGWALRTLGVTPSDPTSPSDTEVASIASALTDKLLDYTELRALQNAATRYVAVDESSEGQSISHDQLRKAIEQAAERKRVSIEQTYGVITPPLRTGRVRLFFQESAPDA